MQFVIRPQAVSQMLRTDSQSLARSRKRITVAYKTHFEATTAGTSCGVLAIFGHLLRPSTQPSSRKKPRRPGWVDPSSRYRTLAGPATP